MTKNSSAQLHNRLKLVSTLLDDNAKVLVDEANRMNAGNAFRVPYDKYDTRIDCKYFHELAKQAMEAACILENPTTEWLVEHLNSRGYTVELTQQPKKTLPLRRSYSYSGEDSVTICVGGPVSSRGLLPGESSIISSA